MPKTSFIDDKSRYVKAYGERNFIELAHDNIANREDLSYFIYEEDELYGFRIDENEPLAQLYDFPVYVERFNFANIDTLHHEGQEQKILRLLNQLKLQMENERGYYNVRIPTHIVDLLRGYNQVLLNAIFCGGTTEQYAFDYHPEVAEPEDIKIFFADADYFEKNKIKILAIIEESFAAYQGQYHISHITEEKAGIIYLNWLAQGFSEKSIIIAEKDSAPIGFLFIGETLYGIDGILSAVTKAERKSGAYKSMLAYANKYANELKKYFTVSTQFDNYAALSGFQSFGFKPYKSIYNIHFDFR